MITFYHIFLSKNACISFAPQGNATAWNFLLYKAKKKTKKKTHQVVRYLPNLYKKTQTHKILFLVPNAVTFVKYFQNT